MPEVFFSPTDYRYAVEELTPYLSRDAVVKYEGKVEAALAKVLANRGVISKKAAEEIGQAASKLTFEEVAREEEVTKHWSRGLANVMRTYVSDEAKPAVHMTATSFDIVDTANALRYRDATRDIIIPDMVKLEKSWLDIVRREANTPQIGRTHGQWAEPLTFGFAMGWYADRFGNRILKVKEAAENLVGKFSGAVGAYNASSLFFDDPESFEREILNELDIKPPRVSTQIAPPEPTTDYLHSITTSFGVLNDFANSMRHLQRSEIAEIGEPFEAKQVGSSTMPKKRNPINFENIQSLYKKAMPHMVTMYLDQTSEHQRDLTNSASQRYNVDPVDLFDFAVRRATRVSSKLRVDEENMRRNLDKAKKMAGDEALYILLSHKGHPDAHEYVKQLTLKAEATRKPLPEIVFEDTNLAPYLQKFTEKQLSVIKDPEQYAGIASRKAIKVANYWETRLKDEGLW